MAVAKQYQDIVGQSRVLFPDDADLLDYLAFKIKDLMQMNPGDPMSVEQQEVIAALREHFNAIHRVNYDNDLVELEELRAHFAGLSYSQIAKELRPVLTRGYPPAQAKAMEKDIPEFFTLCRDCRINLRIYPGGEGVRDAIDPALPINPLVPFAPANNDIVLAMPATGSRLGYVSADTASRNRIESDWYEARKKKLEQSKKDTVGLAGGGIGTDIIKLPGLWEEARKRTREALSASGGSGPGFFGAIIELTMTLITLFQLVTGTEPIRGFSPEELNDADTANFNNYLQTLDENSKKKLMAEWRKSPKSEEVWLQLAKGLLEAKNDAAAQTIMGEVKARLDADIIAHSDYAGDADCGAAILAKIKAEQDIIDANLDPADQAQVKTRKESEERRHLLYEYGHELLVNVNLLHKNRYDPIALGESVKKIDAIRSRL